MKFEKLKELKPGFTLHKPDCKKMEKLENYCNGCMIAASQVG